MHVIWFCISYVIHHDRNSEFTWISKLRSLSYNKCYDNFTKIYFSARCLVRAVIQNRDTCVTTGVESDSGFSSKIGSILPKRLETLQEFFFFFGGGGGGGGVGRACFPWKKSKFEVFKLLEMHWNCLFYHHRAPLPPPCLRAWCIQLTRQSRKKCFFQNQSSSVKPREKDWQHKLPVFF